MLCFYLLLCYIFTLLLMLKSISIVARSPYFIDWFFLNLTFLLFVCLPSRTFISFCSFISNGFQQLMLLSVKSHKVCFSGWSRLVLQLNLGAFDFPFLLIVFLHPLQKAVSALRILGVLSLHINSLGKNLALNLLVHSDAHGMLGDTRKLFWFCCGDTYGPSFCTVSISLMSTISPFL